MNLSHVRGTLKFIHELFTVESSSRSTSLAQLRGRTRRATQEQVRQAKKRKLEAGTVEQAQQEPTGSAMEQVVVAEEQKEQESATEETVEEESATKGQVDVLEKQKKPESATEEKVEQVQQESTMEEKVEKESASEGQGVVLEKQKEPESVTEAQVEQDPQPTATFGDLNVIDLSLEDEGDDDDDISPSPASSLGAVSSVVTLTLLVYAAKLQLEWAIVSLFYKKWT
jgi:hypothetical protein